MAFELPSWLEPKDQPVDYLLKGAQVGVAMGRSIASNMQAYAQIQQAQQHLDLQRQEIQTSNEGRTLQNEIMKEKSIHDSEDYQTLRGFLPKMASASTWDDVSRLSVPQLHDTQKYLQYSLLLDKHKTDKAMGAMAQEIAGKQPGTQEYDDTVSNWTYLAPDIVHTQAYDHLMNRSNTARIQKAKIDEQSEMHKGRLDLLRQRNDILQQRADTYGSTAEQKALMDEAKLAQLKYYQENNIMFRADRLADMEAKTTLAYKAFGLKESEFELKKKNAEKEGYYPEANGVPPHYVDATGKWHFIPVNIGGKEFIPQDMYIGDAHLVQIRPTQWQVIEKALPEGKLTDIQRETFRDLKSQRDAIVKKLPPKEPTEKNQLQVYKVKTERLDDINKKMEAIRDKAENRPESTTSRAPLSPRAPAAAATVPPAAASPAPAPLASPKRTMPTNKADLIIGESYTTPRGEAMWDGENFIPE